MWSVTEPGQPDADERGTDSSSQRNPWHGVLRKARAVICVIQTMPPVTRVRPRATLVYCDHCDVLVGLEGLHVVEVDRVHDVVVVTVGSATDGGMPVGRGGR